MFAKSLKFIILISVSIALSSCSKYQKIQKNQDYAYKYEKALEYYEKGDYFKALTLFDQVMPFYRGTEEAENIAYKYAHAYYNQKEFMLASFYFNRFSKTFPRSEKAEECMFLAAFCKYLDSPVYTLDQTNTKEAINDLQLFINTYPNSDKVEQSNALIDELRQKLQKKDYEIALLFLKMEQYEAAVTAFENLLKDYPDTEYREDALFYTIKAYYYYASKSVRSKRKERYQQATDVYDMFVRLYPESSYNRDIEYMYKKAMKEIQN